MNYWKTETTDDGIFHMYKGECPNYYWEEYEPDIDTEEYYEKNALIKDEEKGTFKYGMIEIREEEI